MAGSIRKSGSKRKNSWELRFYPAGTRSQRSVTFVGTKREAERELARLISDAERGQWTPPEKGTVGDYLDKWLTGYVEPNLSEGTFKKYSSVIRLYLKPSLGDVKLSALHPAQIEDMIADLRKRLSGSTLKTVYCVLQSAMEKAVKMGIITNSPTSRVDTPRPGKTEMKTLSEEQLTQLLQSLKGTKAEVPITLLAFSGMRIGEALGLQWDNVDLEKGFLTISRQLVLDRNSRVMFTEVKSKASRRVIYLPEQLLETLTEEKQRQEQNRVKYGEAYLNLGLVCCHPNGRPIRHGLVWRKYKDALAELGFESLRIHDLRHSISTILFRNGTHPKVVQSLLGHSSIQITMDTYSHVIPSMMRDTANVINGLIQNGNEGRLRGESENQPEESQK